ncbi:hypothetical protein NOC27_1253 [Nitrosococcus oceani AFC27]|nr:hypothetical protein NOC27_1253 [Nitrosococcus oceani AFC27]
MIIDFGDAPFPPQRQKWWLRSVLLPSMPHSGAAAQLLHIISSGMVREAGEGSFHSYKQ